MPGFEDHIALCAGVAIGRKPHIEAQRAAIAAGLTAETQSALDALFLAIKQHCFRSILGNFSLTEVQHRNHRGRSPLS